MPRGLPGADNRNYDNPNSGYDYGDAGFPGDGSSTSPPSTPPAPQGPGPPRNPFRPHEQSLVGPGVGHASGTMSRQNRMSNDLYERYMREVLPGFSDPRNKYDANEIQGGINAEYFRKLSLSPAISSSLKGMGVGGAQGQMALSGNINLLSDFAGRSMENQQNAYSARRNELGDYRDAELQGTQLAFAGTDRERAMLQLINDIELNS